MTKLSTYILYLKVGPWYFQDGQSATNMLKKHNVQEQSVADYAETIQQLSRTARQLGVENHPER